MKRIVLLSLMLSGAAFAQTPRVDPTIQALGQMVQEAQAREAQALQRAYAAQGQVADLTVQLAAEKKRADDAEAAKAP